MSREIDFRSIARIDLSAVLVSVAVSLTLALAGFGVWALIAALLSKMAVEAIGLTRASPVSGGPSFRISEATHLVVFGGVASLIFIVTTLQGSVDVFVAGRVLEIAELGIYTTALQLSAIPASKIMPLIHQVGFPVFSRLQHDAEKRRKYFRQAVRVGSFAIFPALIGLGAVAPEAVPVVLGPRWAGIEVCLMILCFAIPFRVATDLFTSVTMGVGRPEIILGNLLSLLVLMIGAFLFFVRWGAAGMSIAWLVMMPVGFGITLVRTCRIIEVDWRRVILDLAPAGVSSLLMFGAVRGVAVLIPPDFNSPLKLALLILLGAGTYLSFGRLLFPSAATEVRHLVAELSGSESSTAN